MKMDCLQDRRDQETQDQVSDVLQVSPHLHSHTPSARSGFHFFAWGAKTNHAVIG